MTSWLHAVACAHPDIVSPESKEVDFFSYYFDHGYLWYEQQFYSASQQAMGFEVSPSYFHDPRAADRIRAYSKDMRVVILLRDPVDRAYSNHLHEIIKGHIPRCTFAEGLVNNPAYVEQGLYATHLRRWLDRFPAQDILWLIAEDVVRDPFAAAQQLYRSLGVSTEFRSGVLDEQRNESDRARSPFLRALLRAGGQGMRDLNLEELLVNIKKLSGVSHLLRFNSVPIRDEVPAMTADDVRRLREIFMPETVELAALLGLPSLPWKTWRCAAGEA